MNSLFDFYNQIAAHETEAPHNACIGCVNHWCHGTNKVTHVCERSRDLSRGMPQHCDMYLSEDDDAENDIDY